MNYNVIQFGVFFILLIAISIPLGLYIYKVFSGRRVFLSKLIEPIEVKLFQCLKVDRKHSMRSSNYIKAVLIFNAMGLFFLFILQLMQGALPFNPTGVGSVTPDIAFNTASSFVSNTNWQAYASETTMTFFTQFMGLTVQNFVSASTGISVLFALIRGFIFKEEKGVGNFWVDLFRVTMYILLPLAIVVSILLVSQGVIQTFADYHSFTNLETGVKSFFATGPAASQIAIKQLGTNGGGFFSMNSAYPLENPTMISNLIETLSILLLPMSLCVTFGKAVQDRKQGFMIFGVMVAIFILAFIGVFLSEYYAPVIAGVSGQGNLEGKELMFGIGGSSLWAVSTTAASNGSVNAMLDSFTPLGGLIPMFLMQLGEIVFGGVGSGLYGMLCFVILTVFITGLMVGRTPEYLGKKIEPYDMRMVCIVILVPPILTLVGTSIGVMLPNILQHLGNSGAHGFSEILYNFSSIANNNGSAFAGLSLDFPFINILGGFIMIIVRFVPMCAVVLLAGNLASKKKIPASEGTLETGNLLFGSLLFVIIIIVAALSFLPALALGPIAEYMEIYR